MKRLLVMTAGGIALAVATITLGPGSSAEERSSRESVECGPGGRIMQETADVAVEVVKAMPPNTPEDALKEAFSYMDPMAVAALSASLRRVGLRDGAVELRVPAPENGKLKAYARVEKFRERWVVTEVMACG